jgi:hypothetical protein
MQKLADLRVRSAPIPAAHGMLVASQKRTLGQHTRSTGMCQERSFLKLLILWSRAGTKWTARCAPPRFRCALLCGACGNHSQRLCRRCAHLWTNDGQLPSQLGNEPAPRAPRRTAALMHDVERKSELSPAVLGDVEAL